ncbi:SET domain-containing protein [Caballeronia hypogeia]|uniref:SET domain-containing protein n=1 Tax=Caballeronia hypogeia TaxID=1777140 RepID=UPI00077291B5|nr:SET domain-containing protein-lysine N-methyltransferase [Caballeronia hypogeia]
MPVVTPNADFSFLPHARVSTMRRIAVRDSPIHGRGVFATAAIFVGDSILEYKGEIISAKEAQRRYERSTAEDGHTFFFGLDDGRMIDGAQGGNSARWINHSCAPNCEADQEGDRIFIRATRKIEEGAEIFIDYALDVEGRRTAALKRLYACRCGARRCRGTMLDARP